MLAFIILGIGRLWLSKQSRTFAYLAIAGVGACLTYGGWRLLLDKPKEA